MKGSFWGLFLVALSLWAEPSDQIIPGELVHQGLRREYLLLLPKRLMNPQYLVLVLHGGGGTAKGMLDLVDPPFLKSLEEKGILSIWPQAQDKNWNDGRGDWPGAEKVQRIDDVGFIRNLVERIKDQYNLKDPKVFGLGISNGGMMIFRLVSDAPDLFASIATVSSTLPGWIRQKNLSPHNVLMIQGIHDPVIPFSGGSIRPFGLHRGTAEPFLKGVEFWIKTNKGEDNPLVTKGSDYTLFQYPTKWPLQVILFDQGGHTWPGGKQYLGKFLIGETPRSLNAGAYALSFFLEQ